ncbi:MAG: serine hydrolase domain-containing protein [Bacteroidota bacterium]
MTTRSNPALLLALLLLCACQPQPAQQAASETASLSISDSLTNALWAIHQQGQINGFGVAIANDEEVLYANGIGYAHVPDSTPYTAHTLQNIGSVSKTFIGLALLKAQEMGKLKLDDPVNQYLPFAVHNPRFPEDTITLRQLATHTSSILDTETYNEQSYVLKELVTDSNLLKPVSERLNPPDAKIPMIAFLEHVLSADGKWYETACFSENRPGAIFDYTNVGATLAAAVVEVATGQPFDAFVKTHILEPLEMNASGWSFDAIDFAQHSTLYASPDTAIPQYSLVTYPDGGMLTSPADMGRYLSELIKGSVGEGTILTKESYQELFREQLTLEHIPWRSDEDDYNDEYNSGIFMGFTPKGHVGHTGGDPGIAAFMFFNPETKTGSFLMINTSVGNSEGVAEFYAIWKALINHEKRLNN